MSVRHRSMTGRVSIPQAEIRGIVTPPSVWERAVRSVARSFAEAMLMTEPVIHAEYRRHRLGSGVREEGNIGPARDTERAVE